MLLVELFLIVLLTSAPSPAEPLRDLNEVGSARLKVMFWNIYESTLFSANGYFEGIEPDVALEIEYRRNIRKQKFIEHTREEWKKQSLYFEGAERWLEQLQVLLPDVSSGDTLIVKVNTKLESEFYFNQSWLGKITEPQFTETFLAIWLSDKSSYPELRQQLLGG